MFQDRRTLGEELTLSIQQNGMVLEMLNLEDAPQILDFILTIGWH
jgi:hypothetical protein